LENARSFKGDGPLSGKAVPAFGVIAVLTGQVRPFLIVFSKTVKALKKTSRARDFGGIRIMKKVGILMGSASDMPVVKKTLDTLTSLEIPFEVHVYSAHRTPVEAAEFTKNAKKNGFGVIIAAAGMAAHLAGAVAANTTLPVIGIPCKSTNLDGLDALLATVQMPSGIPVATVAIDGATNAALLAAEILALSDEALAEKLEAKRAKDAAAVLAKDQEIAAEYNK
jgi:5-(carboxyamino)imidazole ribonucleotide mutase